MLGVYARSTPVSNRKRYTHKAEIVRGPNLLSSCARGAPKKSGKKNSNLDAIRDVLRRVEEVGFVLLLP